MSSKEDSVRARKGALVQCDASIKAIISKIDQASGHKFIIEELDEETVVIKQEKIDELKKKLEEELRGSIAPQAGRGPDDD